MKLKILAIVFAIVVIALIAFSQTNRKAFAAAEDFPRGALVYAQINDFPAFIKLWNESKFKSKYLASENFEDFKNNHLGRKLASRWAEFNEAGGFPLDLETVANLTETGAAIAVYDVGKLEFVFVAPISDEIFTATKFFQNRNKFAEEMLADGTIIYRATVEADRGRQKQELIYANAKGRFVLATSEKLLSQTLNNIKGAKTKNRLSDEPAFAALSEKIEPHIAAVWVNQTALNDDYYFRRYWLMSDGKNLKNLRAGIFDFEMQEGKLIEHRKFLLNEPVQISPIGNAQAAELLSFLPENIPFYRLQSANRKTIDEAVKNTIFDRRKPEEKQETNNQIYFSSFDDDSDYSSGYYGNLSEKFDEAINDDDAEETIESRAADFDFSRFLQSAAPRGVLTFTAPQILPAPLFVEFNRAAIFNLTSPDEFNREEFEAAIARKLSEQTMIASPDVKLNWESKTENDLSLRVLKLPMLGIEICYTARGAALILTNDANFLRSVLSQRNSAKMPDLKTPITGLTVINLDQKENAYTSVFTMLAANKAADEFFSGNIESLLDSISEVGKIEIKENYSRNLLEEELIMTFK